MNGKKIGILIACLVLVAVNGCSFATIAQVPTEHDKVYTAHTQVTQVKDPGLIKLESVPVISDKDYKAKLAQDDKYYAEVKKTLSAEQFALYKIIDRIIRANNLQYQNWRVGITRNPEEFNAYAVTNAGNLIIVNSALYDTLYTNPDAMASIIAHEFAHLLLGHGQMSVENMTKLAAYRREMQRLLYYAYRQENLRYLNAIGGDHEVANTYAVAATGYESRILILQKKIEAIHAKEREAEFQSDKEGLNLLLKGGYDGKKAMEAIAYIATLPQYYTKVSTHPEKHERKANIETEYAITNTTALNAIGRYNLYNTKPLVVKRSSDGATMVIEGVAGHERTDYHPYTTWMKYKEKAYFEYLKKDYKNAISDFQAAYDLYEKDYTIPLYLSYAYEGLYLADADIQNLKNARHWLKRAKKINKLDKSVLEQENNLKALIKVTRETPKQSEAKQ